MPAVGVDQAAAPLGAQDLSPGRQPWVRKPSPAFGTPLPRGRERGRGEREGAFNPRLARRLSCAAPSEPNSSVNLRLRTLVASGCGRKQEAGGKHLCTSRFLLLAPCFSQMFVQAKLSLGRSLVSRSRIHLSKAIVRSRETRINSDGPAVFRDGI